MGFVPINIFGSHWILGVISCAKQRIQIYDSLGGRHPIVLLNLKKYLRNEYLDKTKEPIPYPLEWELVDTTADTPCQTNGEFSKDSGHH
jgi:Ulp1 family protease